MPQPMNSAAHGEVERLRNTRRPRTQALVLYATFARATWAPDYPFEWPAEDRKRAMDESLEHWGEGMVATGVAPSRRDDPAFVQLHGDFHTGLSTSLRRSLTCYAADDGSDDCTCRGAPAPTDAGPYRSANHRARRPADSGAGNEKPGRRIAPTGKGGACGVGGTVAKGLLARCQPEQEDGSQDDGRNRDADEEIDQSDQTGAAETGREQRGE